MSWIRLRCFAHLLALRWDLFQRHSPVSSPRYLDCRPCCQVEHPSCAQIQWMRLKLLQYHLSPSESQYSPRSMYGRETFYLDVLLLRSGNLITKSRKITCICIIARLRWTSSWWSDVSASVIGANQRDSIHGRESKFMIKETPGNEPAICHRRFPPDEKAVLGVHFQFLWLCLKINPQPGERSHGGGIVNTKY